MSLEKQKSVALSSTQMLQPGEEFSAAASSSVASIAATATSTATATASPSARRGLATGSIVGIVAGAVAVALLAALSFFIGRAKTLKENITWDSATIPGNRTTLGMFSQKGSFYDRRGTFGNSTVSPEYSASPYPQSPEHYKCDRSPLHTASPQSADPRIPQSRHPVSTGFDGAWPQPMNQVIELPAESVEPNAGEDGHEMQEIYAPVKRG